MKIEITAALIIVSLFIIAGCTQVPQQPAPEQTIQPNEQPSQVSEQPETQETRPESKPVANATSLIERMKANLDCSKKGEMQDALEISKEKLAANEEKIRDAESELKLVQGTKNIVNIAAKKKVVEIVKKNKTVLDSRIKDLEALIAKC